LHQAFGRRAIVDALATASAFAPIRTSGAGSGIFRRIADSGRKKPHRERRIKHYYGTHFFERTRNVVSGASEHSKDESGHEYFSGATQACQDHSTMASFSRPK